MNNALKSVSKAPKILENKEIMWVSRPNKEKYKYSHRCPFIILQYEGTYPVNSLLNFLEQFCHPLSNELDHYAMGHQSNTVLLSL